MRAVRYLLLAGLIGAAVTAHADPITYKLDPGHTMVLFSWNHFGFSNPTANLGLGDGTLVFDEKNPAKSSVEVTLPLANLDTHVSALDEHLKKPDFLDADKFSTVTFKSTKVIEKGEGKLQIVGDLTVRGVTKPVTLDASYEGSGKDPWGGERAGFTATTTINRTDFGMTFNKALETGGLLVGEKVELQLEVEAIKAA